MFAFFNLLSKYRSQIEELKDVVSSLRSKNEELVAANQAWAKNHKELEDESRDLAFEIHWDKLNPFSIERMMDGSKPKTVIGYMVDVLDNGVCYAKSKEWYLHCSDETHQRLAQEFVAWRDKNLRKPEDDWTITTTKPYVSERADPIE